MIYLDHNATTPVLPEVIEAMSLYLVSEWGNPSSSYRHGSAPRKAIEDARNQVSSLIHASPSEVIFTSCATESNNSALHAALAAQPSKKHIVTSNVEHPSVLACCSAYKKLGYRVSYLPVDTNGLLSLNDLICALEPDTAVVSLMWANNETGVISPVSEIALACHSRGVLFHCDAVQAIGKIPVDMQLIPADYLSISGHKIGAPKGVGALFVRSKAPFTPLLHGGNQEQSRRGGTENVPFIIGLGIAAEEAASSLRNPTKNVAALRDMLERLILESIRGASVNGHRTHRLPNTTNIHLPGLDNTAVLAMLDQAGICVSTGSACKQSAITPSHVITSMTQSSKRANESIRFSLGRSNTLNDITSTVEKLASISQMMN